MGKSEERGDHRRMDLSSLADTRVYGGPTGDQDMAFTPARWARSVRMCLNCVASFGEGFAGTE